MARREISKQRSQMVVKSNDLIQRSRYTLSVQEHRILLYMISKIKPNDTIGEEYSFEISDFCEVAGLRKDGFYYDEVKNILKTLADKSLWVKYEDGHEELFRWINTAKVFENDGTVKYKFHESIESFLFDLKRKYTQYELINVLAFRSKYSIRLYELLKSYAYVGEASFTLEEIQEKLEAKVYTRWVDFRIKALDVATEEINHFTTDMRVSYEVVKTGRKVTGVSFKIGNRIDAMDAWMRSARQKNILEREYPRNVKRRQETDK